MKIYYITHETDRQTVQFTCIANDKETAISRTTVQLGQRPLKTEVKQSPSDCFMTAVKRKRK